MTNSTDSLEAPVAAASPEVVSATTLDFYTLSRPVQDRFLASASGSGVPQTVLFSPASQTRAFGWLGLAVASALALVLLLTMGYGDLDHGYAVQPVPFVIVHVLLGGAAAFGVAGYLFARGKTDRHPFRLGSYMFPIGVVEANGANIKVHQFSSLLALESSGDKVVLRFPGKTFQFRLPKDSTVEEVERFVRNNQEKFAAASSAQNRRDLAVLDPLRDSGFSNPLSSGVALARPKDQKLLRFGSAVLAGVLVAGLVFFVRNKLGERAIFRAAVDKNTAAAYNAYLARADRRPEVRQMLLPRAELAEARGSLSAVEKYSAEHPDSAIRAEIDLALREELLKALDEVRGAGTLDAIEKFKKEHPAHTLVTPELAEARKAVFASAIEDYRAKAKAGDTVQAFFVDLIGHSRKHGPQVGLRFRRVVPASAERADASIRKSAYYVGEKGLPSQYFDAEHSAPREQDAAKRITEALQSVFSPEVLTFSVGETLEGDGDLPEVDQPTLFVTYRPEMSGGYTTQRPRGVYVGIGFMVYTNFVIPGHDKPLNIKKQSWWLPPDVTQIWRDQLTPEQVYDASAREGFNRYVEKILSILVPSAESADADAEVQADAE